MQEKELNPLRREDVEGTDISALISGVQHGAKVIIIGAGNVGMATIEAILVERGLKRSEVLIIDDITEQRQELTEKDISELIGMRSKEVQQRIDIENILEPKLVSSVNHDFKNYAKELSQQGWKSRPKHKR